ncbi:MAG: hypothetical protein KGH79_04325 [Patescibacteria group bacterium]|nr:hypothetical protein [Patescibacteria group bacterium]
MEIDLLMLGKFLRRLRTIGAIQVDVTPGGGFRLRSHEDDPFAPLSPISFEFATARSPKPGPLGQYEVEEIGKFLWQRAHEHNLLFPGVAGVPHGGTALARAYQAQAYHATGATIQLLTLGKFSEESGKQHVGRVLKRQDLPRGERVLIIEDTVTKGGRVEETVEQVRLEGDKVTHALVFLDRQQRAAANLSKIGVMLYPVATMDMVLNPAVGVVTAQEAEVIHGYLQNA